MPNKEFSLMILEQDLVIILETARIIAIALPPVTPSLSWRIYAQLGYSRDQFDAVTWVSLSILHTHTHKFWYSVWFKLFCIVERYQVGSWLNLNQSLLGLKIKLKWKTKGLQSVRRLWKVKGSRNKLKKLLELRCIALPYSELILFTPTSVM